MVIDAGQVSHVASDSGVPGIIDAGGTPVTDAGL